MECTTRIGLQYVKSGSKNGRKTRTAKDKRMRQGSKR